MASNDPGDPGMHCPRCGNRIASRISQLLSVSVVCVRCSLKLEVDWSASSVASDALRQFDQRLKQIGAAVHLRKAIGVIGGKLAQLRAALRAYLGQDPILLGISSGPIFYEECPPAPVKRIATANLAGVDCTIVLGCGDTNGLRRLRELLESRS